MLGKLIKYEFKSISKVLVAINLFTILISLVGCLTFISPMWELESDYIPFLAISSVAVYYFAIIAVSLLCAAYMAIRFYRNFYTNEGYLMHTLPVTPHQLILSKLIPAFTWIIITIGVIMLSVLSICASAFLKFASASDIHNLFREIPSLFRSLYGMTGLEMLLYCIAALIIGGISGILQSYAAMSMGQMFSKHKVISSVACYIGLYFVTQIITLIVTLPATVKINSFADSNYMISDYMHYTLSSSIILSLLLGAAFYVISYIIMKKKLNLD